MTDNEQRSEFLGGRFHAPMLRYIADHDGCMISELYKDVTGNRSRPDLLDVLEGAGARRKDYEGEADRQGEKGGGTAEGDRGDIRLLTASSRYSNAPTYPQSWRV